MLCWFYAMKVGVLIICKVVIHRAYGLVSGSYRKLVVLTLNIYQIFN